MQPPRVRNDYRWKELKPLLLIENFSSEKKSRLKIAFSQYVVLRNTAYFLMPKIAIIRLKFGNQGTNAHSSLHLPTPHRVKCITGGGWQSAVSESHPLTSGITAFGFRVITSSNSHYFLPGLAESAECKDTSAHVGWDVHRGVGFFCGDGSAHSIFSKHEYRRDVIADGEVTKKASTIVFRVDFTAARTIILFADGAESKPFAIPNDVTVLYPVLSISMANDELESLAEDDPAFNCLFSKTTKKMKVR